MTPFHYFAEGMLTTGLKNAPVTCTNNEVLSFSAPNGQTCGDYLAPYIQSAGGYLLDSGSNSCQFCPISETNTILQGVRFYPERGWQDFGILWIYIFFNFAAATVVYYLVRVPKKPKDKKAKHEKKQTETNQEKGQKSG